MRSESSLLSQPIAVGRQLLNLAGAVVFSLVNAVRWLLFDSWRKRREELTTPQFFTPQFGSESEEDADEAADLFGEGDDDGGREPGAREAGAPGGAASPRRRSLSSPTRRRASLSSPTRRRSGSRTRRGVGGVLPALHWRDGDATGFSLRSATYLENRRKAPSAPACLTLAAVELWQPVAPTEHLAAHPNGFLARAARTSLDASATPFTLAVNFMNPGNPAKGLAYTSIVLYFQSRDRATLPQLLQRRTPLAASLRRFLEAEDAERATMLKIIASVVSGPMALKALVPRTPVVIGNHVRMVTHVARDNSYAEIDLNVSSSSLGDWFFRHLFHRAAAHVVTELAFLFEGSRCEELPEQAFGVAYLANIGPDLARPLPPAQ